MAKARKSRQKGLNAPPPKRLEDTLTRQYRKVNAIAMAEVRKMPPEVLTDPVALDKALAEIDEKLTSQVGDDWVRAQASKAAGQFDRRHSREFFRGLEKSGQVQIEGTDSPVFRGSPIRAPRVKSKRRPVLVPKTNMGPQLAMDQFADNNVQLVAKFRENITFAMREQLATAAAEAQLSGETPGAALERVKKKWRQEGAPSAIPSRRRRGMRLTVSANNHAALVARDQISTLNSSITKSRQTAAGIEDFSWQTQKDNRVRDEHRELHGTEHSWQSGANGVFPGEPINCRCWAQAVVDPSKVRESDGFVRVQPPAA